MPFAFNYLIGAAGFALFSLLDPKYLGLCLTMIGVYLTLFVVWGVIDTVEYWPRRRDASRGR